MRVPAVAALALLLMGGAATAAALLDLPVRHGEAAPQPLRGMVGDARTVVTFWASYCAPCRAEVPALNAAASRWAPRDVRIVGVAVDLGDAAEVARVATAWGITYPTWWVHPGAQGTAQALMPEGLPTSFFVWKDRVVRHAKFLTAEELDRLVMEHFGVARPH